MKKDIEYLLIITTLTFGITLFGFIINSSIFLYIGLAYLIGCLISLFISILVYKKIFKNLKEWFQDFWRYNVKWKYEEIAYRCWRVPFWKLKYIFKWYRDDLVPWDITNCQELIFSQFIMFFEENEEYLKPWLQDGKWMEHKHSEGWEGVPKGKGTGLKYKDMLEIYMYVKYIRHENKKKEEELLDKLYGEEGHRSWWEDVDEEIDGKKCKEYKGLRLKNYKVKWKYSKSEESNEDIHDIIEEGNSLSERRGYPLFADNLLIDITELKTISDEYRKDTDAHTKIDNELTELDNTYAKKIIDIRGYLWW